MMFSKVGESVVDVVRMIGVSYEGKETIVSGVTSEGLPLSSICEASSPIVTFPSILDTFKIMSEVCATSETDLAIKSSSDITTVGAG